jgi:hypothetical protein
MPKHDTSALQNALSPKVDSNPGIDIFFTPMNEEGESKLFANSASFKAPTYGDEKLEELCRSSKSRHGSHASLHLPRPRTQRALSNSQIELLSNRTNLVGTFLTISLRDHTDARHDGTMLLESSEIQIGNARRACHSDFDMNNTAPGLYSYGCARSKSDPTLRTTCGTPARQHTIAPLKTCMKKKARGTTTSPHAAEFRDVKDDDSETRSLRRVKTFDFVKTTASWLTVRAQAEACKKLAPVITKVSRALSADSIKSTTGAYKTTPCPHTIGSVKSSLADPATTRTDVHVIAIAPSCNIDYTANQGSVDPATPTMQIVESSSGCYEVIWDDVPSEHSIRINRRSSSASHSLVAVSSTSTRGLQRVNSKLKDWSGTRNTPSEKFKPTIVVFPDDDGRPSHFESTAEDEEDAVVIAPPNSQRTGVAPSRLPSRPVSAPMTRAVSWEDLNTGKVLQQGPPVGWIVPTLTAPNPNVQSMRGTRRIPGFRKLSNLEEEELKFRGHRDSVTLAHSRLVHSGGVSPELLAHRDSVSIGRKRMYERNHAISLVREVSIPNSSLSKSISDEDDSYLSLPLARDRAVQALKSKTLPSMLDAQEP